LRQPASAFVRRHVRPWRESRDRQCRRTCVRGWSSVRPQPLRFLGRQLRAGV